MHVVANPDILRPSVQTQKARTLSEVPDAFDPRPLQAEQIQAFFVERRERPARRKMQAILERSIRTNEPVKLLFTGHIGSGKSTELNKLIGELGGKFFVVRVNTQPLISPLDVRYIDILLIAIAALYRQALNEGALSPTIGDRVDDVADSMLRFLRDKILAGNVRKPLDSPEIGVNLGTILGEFEVRFKNESLTRDQIRGRVEQNVAELIEQVDILSSRIRSRLRRPVLFVFEDTDKAGPEQAESIFFHHYNVLTAFSPAAIYTFPINLRYTQKFNTVKDYFDGEFRLPNMPIYLLAPERSLLERTAAPDEDGRRHLREVIERRMEPGLMTDDARDLLIEASGGVTRQLVTLVSQAALEAVTRGAGAIERPDAEFAAKELTKDFATALRQQDYQVLARRYLDKQLTGDSEVQGLLHLRSLLEYENGEIWCDVHPAALPLVRERSAGDSPPNSQ